MFANVGVILAVYFWVRLGLVTYTCSLSLALNVSVVLGYSVTISLENCDSCLNHAAADQSHS